MCNSASECGVSVLESVKVCVSVSESVSVLVIGYECVSVRDCVKVCWRVC